MYINGQDINSINDNIAMPGTAFVSAFYDVRDVLNYQNRKNDQSKTQYLQQQQCFSTERRNLSTTSVTKGRALSTSSFVGSPLAPEHHSQQPQTTLTSNALISNIAREHRKLDRSISEPVGVTNQNASVNNNTNQNLARNVNSSRYKTELCRPFEENGDCKYKDKCQFAHGLKELRSISRHPKFKTELCRTYHTVGFCPYGHRCHFIHNEDEFQKTQRQCSSPTEGQFQTIQAMKRPSTINFSSSFNGSMGSSGDSVSSSASHTPSHSPTLFMEFSSQSSSASDRSSVGSVSPHGSGSPVFNYSATSVSPTDLNNLASMLTPLNIQTQPQALTTDLLSQQFQSIVSLNQENNNQCVFSEMDTFVAPPSPQDSISGDSVGSSNSYSSALDISKSLRLPIFNKLSQELPM